MNDTFKFGVHLLDNPRYDSKPTQPKDKGEMSFAERDALFDATLDRDDVADSVWESVIDEISPELGREIVRTLFRQGGGLHDFHEAGRLIHRACARRVEKIVEDHESETVMDDEK